MVRSASQLVQRIHATPLKLALATAGGGASAVDRLLATPGASRTVLEAVVPYSAGAMRRFLGGVPQHYCSAETARSMAAAAFQRGLDYVRGDASAVSRSDPATLAGMGCTASLASDRPKRGSHRAHLAVQTSQTTIVQSLEFMKGRRSRSAEEKLLGRWLLNLIAQTAGLAGRLELSLLDGEAIQSEQAEALPDWGALLLGDVLSVRHGPAAGASETRSATKPMDEKPLRKQTIFSGAFNPRHVGHKRLAEVACRRLNCRVEHEISILNVDKPPLDFIEMKIRLAQFTANDVVWFTRAARFSQKAELFPGATFLVGADTIERIADPKYYDDDPLSRDRAIRRLAHYDCRLLVFGRRMGGTFRSLSDLALPATLRNLSDEIPASEFREDISSGELRDAASELPPG